VSGPWVWRHARKVVVAIIGGTVMLIGLALLALPGPGLLVILVGLAILATEFAFAARWLRLTKERAKMLTEYAQRQGLAVEPSLVSTRLGAIRAGLRSLEWASTLLFVALIGPLLIVIVAQLLGLRLGGAFGRGGSGAYAVLAVMGLAGVLHLAGTVLLGWGVRRRRPWVTVVGAAVVVSGVVFMGTVAIGQFAPQLMRDASTTVHQMLSTAMQINAMVFLVGLSALLSHLEADPAGERGALGPRMGASSIALGVFAVAVVLLYWWPVLRGQRLVPVVVGGWGQLLFALVYIFYVGAMHRARKHIEARMWREREAGLPLERGTGRD
jgi:uncharacterized protein (TIGR02611 family)